MAIKIWRKQMQIYKCDVCDEIKPCEEIEIERKIYDLCKKCKAEMETKLKGKGRQKLVDIVPYIPTPCPWKLPYEPWTIYPTTTTWISDNTTYVEDAVNFFSLTDGKLHNEEKINYTV